MKTNLLLVFTAALMISAGICPLTALGLNEFGSLDFPVQEAQIPSIKKSLPEDLQKDIQRWEGLYDAVTVGKSTENDIIHTFGALKPVTDDETIVKGRIFNNIVFLTTIRLKQGKSEIGEYIHKNAEPYAGYTPLTQNHEPLAYSLDWADRAGEYRYEFSFTIDKGTDLVTSKTKTLIYAPNTA